MKREELLARVHHALMLEGFCQREEVSHFRIELRKVRKMLRYSVP